MGPSFAYGENCYYYLKMIRFHPRILMRNQWERKWRKWYENSEVLIKWEYKTPPVTAVLLSLWVVTPFGGQALSQGSHDTIRKTQRFALQFIKRAKLQLWSSYKKVKIILWPGVTTMWGVVLRVTVFGRLRTTELKWIQIRMVPIRKKHLIYKAELGWA